MFGITFRNAKTPAGLVKFALNLVGNPYWYGTCGWPCTDGLLTQKARQYPGHYTASRMPRYRDDIARRKTCADCVGLIKAYGWQQPNGQIGYAINGVPDQSANGMYNAARVKGNIGTLPLNKFGLAVRFDGHIGVYVGNNQVVEARGFNHGIVVTNLHSRPWTHWLEVPWLHYHAVAAPPQAYPLGFGERTLRQGMTGDDVRAMQRALIALNYTVGIWGADGDFGPATRLAVVAYQYSRQLTQDGIVGPLTRGAMEADLPDILHDNTDEFDKEPIPDDFARKVRIEGGNAFIRLMPSTLLGQIIGVAKEGEEYTYAGETCENGWHAVRIDEEIGWISGLFAKLVG